MRLLRTDVDDLMLEDIYDEYENNPTKYAILSHTWLADHEEVTFDDLHLPIEALRARPGWRKIEGGKEQASRDGLKYIWIDTVCINKSSSTELAEAINSMYRWYEKSQVCYVYLQDLPDPVPAYAYDGQPSDNAESSPLLSSTLRAPWSVDDAHWPIYNREATTLASPGSVATDIPLHTFQKSVEAAPIASGQPGILLMTDSTSISLTAFSACRWFTRGWTLQELLAPARVYFFTQSWMYIENSPALFRAIADISGIHHEALAKTRRIETYSIAQRMSWAARRNTKRIEDRTYSLLGIFKINMAIMYGEGERAFRRLQEELMRVSSDQTIFAFNIGAGDSEQRLQLLAKSPSDFEGSYEVVTAPETDNTRFEATGRAVDFDARLYIVRERHQVTEPYFRLVLACYVLRDPSRYIVLHLKKKTASTPTYTIAKSRCLEAVDQVHSGRKQKRGLIRVPIDDFTHEDRYSQPMYQAPKLCCRIYPADWMLSSSSTTGSWNTENCTFDLAASGYYKFTARLEIRNPEGQLFGHLTINETSQASDPRLPVHFDNGLASLPWWCVHGLAIKQKLSGVLIANVYQRRTLHGLVPFLEIRFKPTFSAYAHIFWQITLWASAFVFYASRILVVFLSFILLPLAVLLLPPLALAHDPRHGEADDDPALYPFGYLLFILTLPLALGVLELQSMYLRVFHGIEGVGLHRPWFYKPLDYWIPKDSNEFEKNTGADFMSVGRLWALVRRPTRYSEI